MAPWSPPHGRPYYVWVPEGSCFPPSYLKRYLRARYGPVSTHLPSAQGESRLVAASSPTEHSESRSRSLRRCASHCIPQTRVPDHTPAFFPLSFPPVRNNGKLRRWSLGAPPSYLSTEFIARHLDSQRIDVITGAQLAQSDASNDDKSLPLPAIKVSTSTTTIALSFPGSPEGSTPAPEPLAIRRGKKMPAPVAVHSLHRAEEEYPGIPTAFLGTPSAYLPHFHITSSSIAPPNANSIPIGDMISALRSQAASLKVSSPTETYTPMLDISTSLANSLSASSSDIAPNISEDDWAFAHDLMSRYGDRARDGTPTAARHHQLQVPSTGKSLVPKARSPTQTSRVYRASVPAATSTPNNRPKFSSASRTDLSKPRHSTGITRQRKDYKGTSKHISHRDSMPGPQVRPLSPVTPNHTRAHTPESSNNSRREHSTKRPPGILKRAKSVRFADMSKPDDARDNAPSESQPRTSLSKDAGGSPLHPSPLRTSFLPEELEVHAPSRQPLATPTTEDSNGVFTVDRHDTVQLAPSQAVNLRSSIPVTPGLSDKSSLSGGSRAVKRLSLLIRELDKDKAKEKENSPLALRSQRRARRHTEVDENSARRVSRGSRKHRLSSPLKSFLERLRA